MILKPIKRQRANGTTLKELMPNDGLMPKNLIMLLSNVSKTNICKFLFTFD